MSAEGTGRVIADTEIEAYARAAARLSGLTIAPGWWPEIVRHTRVMIEAAHPGSLARAAAPTFEP
jgi:hypothetical protein